MDIKNGGKNIELQMLYSDYHYQIDPSAHGVYDRLIIQVFIKDLLQTRPISRIPYHTIIINNADRLTIEAQQSLRRTLEKNVANSRFIFIIGQESTMIESLVSRCIQIRLASPTVVQTTKVLSDICHEEKIEASLSQLDQIAEHSQRNLSKAIWWLQLVSIDHKTSAPFNFEEISLEDKYLDDLVQEIISAQAPQDLLKIRASLDDLLVHCIEPTRIMKYIFIGLLDYLEHQHASDDHQKHQLVQIINHYENTLKQGSKPIYHLEGMCVAIINLLASSA